MLSSLVKEHQQNQTILREEIESRRKVALASVDKVALLLTEDVNESVADVFLTQKQLDKEAKALQASTQRFAKQTTQWLAMISQFNTSLKELGDFQNWAKTVEWDMKNIASALEYVSKVDARAAAQQAH